MKTNSRRSRSVICLTDQIFCPKHIDFVPIIVYNIFKGGNANEKAECIKFN